jgi:hypothetical protein
MINFKKITNIPYIGSKFLLIILVLGLFTLISDTFTLLALILTIAFTAGLVGLQLLSQLKHYDKKTIIKILELSLIYLVSSFIFLFIEGVFLLIFLIPIYLLKALINTENIFVLNFGILLLILTFIIMIVGFIIIDYIKNIGFMKYLKSNKFEDFFEFKKNLKIIFTKNFWITQIFLFGYILLLMIAFVIILSLSSLIFPVLSNYFIGVFIIFFIYFWFSSVLVSTFEIYKAHK